MRQTQDHAHALTSARSPMIVRDWLFGIGPWLLAAPFFCTALWAQEVPVTRATPSVGQVTSFPLPRYVSLKSREGNARRGPSLTHRIDWIFSHIGMPLKITAEFENWRRIEDWEGMGGWMHYSLLSGVRSALITAKIGELRLKPDLRSPIVVKAEMGVVAKVSTCNADWCKLTLEGYKGWIEKTALWGVSPDEAFD